MATNSSYAVFPQIQSRQLGAATPMKILRTARGSTDFITRLGKWRVLTGHDGCVNTIAWNDSGDKILSGSDDCHLNIYDVGKNKLLESIRSGHRANIFSARFLPLSSDRKIISCCGGGMVHYNEVGMDAYYGQNFFNCHSGTTYELTVIPGDPNSFLTCGEDGTVRHFDLRVKTSCYCSECREDILIERQNAITSIMVNPLMPYHLAVGCEDSFVRIYDMRAIGTERERTNFGQNERNKSGLISIFKPPNLKKSSCRVTSLRYNDTGDEILVSYCTDYVYLFSINKKVKVLGTGQENSSPVSSKVNGVSGDDAASNLPPVKRLRLRGDWSDTGPNARPENEQDREENNTSSLMQRISDVFSRWLEDAFNEGTNRTASQGDENEGGEDNEQTSGSVPPNDDAGRSPLSPLQPEASQSSVTLDSTDITQHLRADNTIDNNQDDVNPVENLVEELDLDSRDVGEDGSRFESEESKQSMLSEPLDDDCETPGFVFQDKGLEERAIVAGKAGKLRDGGIEMETEGCERPESPSVSEQLCTCGANDGLLEESCSVQNRSSLSSNNFIVSNGGRQTETLSLSKVDFEDTNMSMLHIDMKEKRKHFEPNGKDILRDVDEGLSTETNSLTSSKTSEVCLGDDIKTYLQNAFEERQNEPLLHDCENAACSCNKLVDDETSVSSDLGKHDSFENPGSVSNDSTSEQSIEKERTSSATVGDVTEINSRKNLAEASVSRNSPPNSLSYDEDLEGTGFDAVANSEEVTVNDRSERRSSEENSFRNSHIRERESTDTAAYSRSSRVGPSRMQADLTTASRLGPFRDISARRRHAAATRIQRCFRLQKKKTESHADFEEDFLKHYDMPTPIMCYKGHRNARTMIKEANFWGDKFIISGSDCGRVFVWDRQTADLVVLLEGDKHVVNCVQPHPFDPLLATSGIDYDIKVWAPIMQSPAALTNLEEIINRNEQMLEESRDTITVPASFMLRMLASLSRVRGQRRNQQRDEDDSNDDSDD